MTHANRQQSVARVLVVEDNATARAALREFLNFSGYEVACAATPGEATRVAASFQPDVLVSDWDLGETRDGVDVARELQADTKIQVIFVTGNSLEQLRNHAEDLEVYRFLRKPVSLPRLAQLIAEIPTTRH